MRLPWIGRFWCCCSSKPKCGRTWDMMVLVLWRLSTRATLFAALITKPILGSYQVLWAIPLLKHYDEYHVLVGYSQMDTAKLTSGSSIDTDVIVISKTPCVKNTAPKDVGTVKQRRNPETRQHYQLIEGLGTSSRYISLGPIFSMIQFRNEIQEIPLLQMA